MALLQLSIGKGGKRHSSDTTEQPCNQLIKKQREKPSWTLTCPSDWPHLSQCWWDSRVPAGYWWWGCAASSYRNQRCPGLVSLHFLHGNSTGQRTYSFNITHAGSDKSPTCLREQPGISGIPEKTPKVTVRDDVLLLHSRIWSLHCNSAKRFRK